MLRLVQAAVGTAARGRGGMEEDVGRGLKEEEGGRGEGAAEVEAICEMV